MRVITRDSGTSAARDFSWRSARVAFNYAAEGCSKSSRISSTKRSAEWYQIYNNHHAR
jgi:hypothetical protein